MGGCPVRSRTFLIALAAVLLPAGLSYAGAPTAPVAPKSMSECNQFNDLYIHFLLALNQEASLCVVPYSDVYRWVDVPQVCPENFKWHIPPQCAALRQQYNQESCQHKEQYEECKMKVASLPPDSVAEWKTPADALSSAQRLGSILNDPDDPERDKWAKAAEKAANAYGHVQSGLVILNSKAELGDRLSALSSELSDLSLSNNELAKELLDKAVNGTIQLNSEALDMLMKEMDQFSDAYQAELKQQIESANAALSSASAAKRQERLEREALARQQEQERQQQEQEQQQPQYEEPQEEAPSDPNDWIYQTYTDAGVRAIQGCVIRGNGCNACFGGDMGFGGVMAGNGENCNTPEGLSRAIGRCTPVCGLDSYRR